MAVGALALAFIGYAVVTLSRQTIATGMVEGVILGKDFVPAEETQVTVGRGGVNSRRIAGEYSFRVRVPQEGGREYQVLVDETVYQTRQAGDHLIFQR